MKIPAVFILATMVSTLATAEPQTFECEYKLYSDNTGSHTVKNKFELLYIVDAESQTAYLHGNMGSSKVQPIGGNGSISFIEVTPVGNVMVTTVDSSLKSVHSRNTVSGGELIPSQYYGQCVIK